MILEPEIPVGGWWRVLVELPALVCARLFLPWRGSGGLWQTSSVLYRYSSCLQESHFVPGKVLGEKGFPPADQSRALPYDATEGFLELVQPPWSIWLNCGEFAFLAPSCWLSCLSFAFSSSRTFATLYGSSAYKTRTFVLLSLLPKSAKKGLLHFPLLPLFIDGEYDHYDYRQQDQR